MFLAEEAARALLLAKNSLPEGLNLKIKDGKRSLAEQRRIVKQAEKELKKSHPDSWQELLTVYTGGYEELKLKEISFMNHRSGLAVDLTIIKGEKDLDMGGVQLSAQDRLNFFERKSKLTRIEKVIRDNRRLLKAVMRKAGFMPYPLEWWHWGYEVG